VSLYVELQALNSSLTTVEAQAQVAELTKAVILLTDNSLSCKFGVTFYYFLNLTMILFSILIRPRLRLV